MLETVTTAEGPVFGLTTIAIKHVSPTGAVVSTNIAPGPAARSA